MKKVLLILLLILAIGGVAFFVSRDSRTTANLRTAARDGSEEAMDQTAGRAERQVRQIGSGVKEGTVNTAETLNNGVKAVDQMALDTSITAAVKMKLANDEVVSASDIHVATQNGVVTLQGKVSSQVKANIATELAKSVDGVQGVNSELQILEQTTS